MKDNAALLVLALPAIVYFLVFHYLPMFGVVLAFKNYNYADGIWGSRWVGLKNFEFFFTSQDAWRVTRNTVGYSALFIVAGTIAAVAAALLLYEIRRKAALAFYQTTMILPRFLSWVIVGYLTYTLFHPTLGLFNQGLAWIGQAPANWYAETQYWPTILTSTEVWKTIGISSIMYYAALMGNDPELYEAATIDGAGRWKQTWAISIPSLYPVMTILILLSVGNMFRADFGLFYQIPRDVGILYPVTDVIDTYVYRGLRNGNLAVTAAVGMYQSVAGLILLLIVNAWIRKVKPENALF